MNKGIKTKYIFVVAGILLLFYVGYQIHQITYNPIKSIVAEMDTVYDSVEAEAVFIRDESVITSNKTGTMVYNVKDGSRVEKGGTIANVFSSESEANAFAQLSAIEKKITYYENIILLTNASNTSLDVIDSNIQSSLNSYIRSINSGKLDGADAAALSVIDHINNRKITIGENIDVNSILNELYAQRKNLETTISKSDAVIAEEAGYFVSTLTGTEGNADYQKATELSVSNIQSILGQKQKQSAAAAVGKVIKSFDWYIALVVEDSDVITLETGNTVSVAFPQSDAGELSATVAAINQDSENAHKVAFILKLDNMDENIAKIRSGKVEVRFNKYTGIKIPNDALRAVTLENKETGEERTQKCVYVLSGNIVKRKYVEVVYNGQDFVLAKSNTTQTGYVRLYDKVIVKGEDLDDGKVVRYTGRN